MAIEVKEKTPVMISGPGKMGMLMASKIIRSDSFRLHPFALAEDNETRGKITVEGQEIQLLNGAQRASFRQDYLPTNIFVLDFTEPAAVMPNVDFYCAHGLNFVMGTTGGDMAKIAEKIKGST